MVPPAYTTMTCSDCGTRAKSRLLLSERVFVCESCGTVTEVARAFYRHFEQSLARDFDFLIAPHHFAVHGRCRSCAGKPPLLPHSGNRSEQREP